MIPIEQIRHNIHWIGVAIDGYLAMPKSGGELHDKRNHQLDSNIVLFEKEGIKDVINYLAGEIINLNKL